MQRNTIVLGLFGTTSVVVFAVPVLRAGKTSCASMLQRTPLAILTERLA